MSAEHSSEEGGEGLRLTDAEESALCEAMEAWADTPSGADSASPYAVVERILAGRLAAVQAERDGLLRRNGRQKRVIQRLYRAVFEPNPSAAQGEGEA